MYKHKPIPKTNVIYEGKEYKCNPRGILELPVILKKFNPIEKEKKIVKKDKVDD